MQQNYKKCEKSACFTGGRMEDMFKMQQIINSTLLFYLAAAAVKDIRQRKVSMQTVICFSAAAILLKITAAALQTDGAASSPAELFAGIAGGMMPGLFLSAAAYITRQAVGYGDGAALMVCGMYDGFQGSVLILTGALFFSAAAALYFVAVKKAGLKKEIPFVPCLLFGYVIRLGFGG